MIISISLVRKTFFFIEDITVVKGSGAVDIDITNRSDVFINAICMAIRSNTIEANIDIQDLVKYIRDVGFRIVCQKNLGLTPDTVAVVEAVVEQTAIEDNEVIEDVENEEERKEEGLLIDLLNGNIKQVTAKIRSAELSDEQRLELIELEEANKNRAIVIAAINEA